MATRTRTPKDELETEKEKVQTTKVTDLSDFDSMLGRQEEGIPVKIYGPNGQELGFSIFIVGPDTDRAAEALSRALDAQVTLAADTDNKATPVQLGEKRKNTYLSEVAIGWSPNPLRGGVSVPFSREACLDLISRYKFIRDQLEHRHSSRASFM